MFESRRRNIPVERRLSSAGLFSGPAFAAPASDPFPASTTLTAAASLAIAAPAACAVTASTPGPLALVVAVAVKAQGQLGGFDGGLIHASALNRTDLGQT